MVLRLQNGQTGVTVPGYGQRGQCRDLTYKACLRDVLRKLDPIPGIRLANRLLWLQPIEAVCLATQCENGRSSLARPGAYRLCAGGQLESAGCARNADEPV